MSKVLYLDGAAGRKSKRTGLQMPESDQAWSSLVATASRSVGGNHALADRLTAMTGALTTTWLVEAYQSGRPIAAPGLKSALLEMASALALPLSHTTSDSSDWLQRGDRGRSRPQFDPSRPQPTSKLSPSTLDRREFLRSSLSASLAAASFTWSDMGRGAHSDSLYRGRGSAASLGATRELVVTLRSLDNRYGGGCALSPATLVLDGQLLPMLREGRYDASVGSDLRATMAELAHLAGWAAHDVDLHTEARRRLGQALSLANDAEDYAFASEIVAAQSQQALWTDQVADALDLALAAQKSAARTGIWPLLSESYVAEAHARARDGDGRGCARALMRAERELDRPSGSPRPEWLGYFDKAYLAARSAHCLRELGDAHQAEELAKRSLDMDDRFVRGRQFNLVLLATTQVETDVEQACSSGNQALDLAGGLQSARARKYIANLQWQLTPYHREPTVRQFTERAAELQGSG